MCNLNKPQKIKVSYTHLRNLIPYEQLNVQGPQLTTRGVSSYNLIHAASCIFPQLISALFGFVLFFFFFLYLCTTGEQSHCSVLPEMSYFRRWYTITDLDAAS